MLVGAESSINDYLALRGYPKIFPVEELQKPLFGAFVSCICHRRSIEPSIQSSQLRSVSGVSGVRLKVSVTAIWSAAASEARRRFGLCLCRIHLKTSLSSQSGVALRLPPHSIESRSVTDSFNPTQFESILEGTAP